VADSPAALADALRDRYLLERELGRGGMATVHLARDLKHGRPVALKVLHPVLAHALGSERFQREIRFAARLQHPHILSVHDSGESAGLLWFTMPYVEGESLRDRLRRGGPLPVAEAVRLVREVAEALGYAHRQGIVHRDVKPENVLLAHGHALVADFGIARSTERPGDDADAPLTETGMTIGTVSYMSPEQANGRRDTDGRSDIYSLGCMLHELLTGRPPFTGPNAMAVITQHFMTPPPPLRTLRADVPARVEAAVLRALAKEREARFATAEEFAAALEPAVAAAPTAVVAAPTVVVCAPAIAVLDFVNVTHDQGLSWLAGGMAETLQLDLQKVPGLVVTGRDRVARDARARGGDVKTAEDAALVGRALGARWVVLGSFQSAGPNLRVTAQCVAAESGELLVASRFDGTLDEIFALQDRVVAAIVERLATEVSGVQVPRTERPERPERRVVAAYEAYAKGRQAFRTFGPAAFDEAERWFRLALDTDPTYALAYSGLGSLFAFRYITGTRREDLDAAVDHLERAIELDPDLGEARMWLCYAYSRRHRYAEAEAAGLRAAELAPDNFHAHYMLAIAHHIGALDERRPQDLGRAVEPYLRAMAAEPTGQPAYLGLGWLYAVDGQYQPAKVLIDCALSIERSGVTREVKFVGARTLRAGLHLRDREPEAARRLLAEAVEMYPRIDHVYSASFTAMSHCLLGELSLRAAAYDEAITAFQRAGELADASPHRIGMGYLAVRAGHGLARAFRWLFMKREEAQAASAAAELLEQRAGYAFDWMWGVSDAEARYDAAAYAAAAGHLDRAIEQLEQGVAAGWRDTALLDHDSEFQRYRGEPALGELRARVEAIPKVPVSPAIAGLASRLGDQGAPRRSG
jgi:serine/threonine protein kinase